MACLLGNTSLDAEGSSILLWPEHPAKNSVPSARSRENTRLVICIVKIISLSIVSRSHTHTHTRMMGMRSLSALHAPSAAGLSEGKCSHALCLPGYISAKGDTTPE